MKSRPGDRAAFLLPLVRLSVSHRVVSDHGAFVMTSKRCLALIAVAGCILLAACAERPMGHGGDPAFIRGVIDGFLAPISFVLSLFSETIRMYAYPNIGRWYDAGFLLGISAWGGGGGVVTRYVYVDRRSRQRVIDRDVD